MLKLKDLADRSDFETGGLHVSPSRRRVEGPAGEVQLEPLVMQVFLLLLDANGRVVTRNDLFDQCWGGVVVGDDSLNRAIAKVRRIASETAPGLFEIETIPRTGYRLTGAIVESCEDQPSSLDRAGNTGWLSRRSVIASGAAAVALAASGGVLWATRSQSDPRFNALMDNGNEALRLDRPAAEFFSRAVSIEPRNATARGLLAYALVNGAGYGPSEINGRTAALADRTARSALAIDPEEPNALLTMLLIQSDMLDWLSREQRYRQIVEIAPANTLVLRSFGQFLHGVGRCRESLVLSERAVAIDPVVPFHQVTKALRLWVLGRTPESDSVIDRAMELWPTNRMVRLARLMIYAFTGRASAAMALIDDERKEPILLTPATESVWRVSLRALDRPTPEAVALARDVNLEAAKGTAAVAAWAILVLSALGQVDAAFDVANGFLLGRGSIVVKLRPDGASPPVHGPGWRNTYGLFTPPAKAMRLDARFSGLADGLGLTDYWRKRGIGPDGFLFQA